MDAFPCVSRDGVAVRSGAATREGCLMYDGLLWMGPGAQLRTWHGANSLTRYRMEGVTPWRLPTASELASLFRSGLPLRHGWPRHFFWTRTTGANSAHYVVHHSDAEIYVHDNDNDLFCCTLVHRLPADCLPR